MRMMGQGLGPGFTRVATRRSVIFSLDGLELVLTPLGKASVRSPASTKPPTAIAEVFSTSRRSNVFPPFFFMTRCPLKPQSFLNLSYRPGYRPASSQRIYGQNKISRLTNCYSFESFGRNEGLPPAGRGDSTRHVCQVAVFLPSEVIFYEGHALLSHSNSNFGCSWTLRNGPAYAQSSSRAIVDIFQAGVGRL